MYRYRDKGATTRTSLERLDYIKNVGKIKTIRGYRFSTTHSSKKRGFTYPCFIPNLERVMVIGEKGTARFSGFCWSYSGEGPRGLVKLLQYCNVPLNVSEKIAFSAPRNSTDQVDWVINLTQGKFQTNQLQFVWTNNTRTVWRYGKNPSPVCVWGLLGGL